MERVRTEWERDEWSVYEGASGCVRFPLPRSPRWEKDWRRCGKRPTTRGGEWRTSERTRVAAGAAGVKCDVKETWGE